MKKQLIFLVLFCFLLLFACQVKQTQQDEKQEDTVQDIENPETIIQEETTSTIEETPDESVPVILEEETFEEIDDFDISDLDELDEMDAELKDLEELGI